MILSFMYVVKSSELNVTRQESAVMSILVTV